VSRSVPEWVADNDDQAIPPRVKVRIFERCGGRCALTGVKLGPGTPFDYDHITPLILGGQHRESNLQTVAREAHRAKTADDVKLKAKVARVRAKHLGVYPKSKTPIRSRGFARTRDLSRLGDQS
jgi:5-methylcytosine-specific restriction protein A